MEPIDDALATTQFLLYRRYVGAIAARFFEEDADIEDVRQEVFMELFQRWGSIQDKNRLRGWLAQVTVRTAARRARAHRRRRAQHEVQPFEETKAAARTTDAGVRLDLRRGLASLGHRDRRAFVLRRVEGRGPREVASACDCSLATAKRRVASADAALRRELAA